MRFFFFFQSLICFSCLWGILNIKHGRNYSLECLNDYIFTIRCKLNMSSETRPRDALYWLEFYDKRDSFECVLTSLTYAWMCVLNLSTRVELTFMDTDIYQISLNYSYHGNNDSVVMSKKYMPVKYIQPVSPSNLMLLWKPDEAVFHWLSGYDESIDLVPFLQYQLRIQRNGQVFDVHSTLTNMSVPTSTFAANANYTARVRSAPHQIQYKGVWSHWGHAVYWTTGPSNIKKANGPETFLSRVWLLLFLLPVMLLCYFSYTRCKRCLLKPSPAPHIRDFKCSVTTPENVAELLQKEQSLLIDSLIEELNPVHYDNDSTSHASFSGSSKSSGMLQSSVGSKTNTSSWTQASILAEKGSVTYSVDYCTISGECAVNTRELIRTQSPPGPLGTS